MDQLPFTPSPMSDPQYDFKQPIQAEKKFEDYLKHTEQNLRDRLHYKRPVRNHHLWAIVTVLLVSLVGLGTYTLLQKRKSDQDLATMRSSVAGVSENADTKNIVTAEGFSIVLNQATPDSFKLDRRTEPFDYVTNKTATITRFLARENQDNHEVLSGIEVYVSEYDNKLDRNAFDKAVLTKLGPDFEIKSNDINIPKDFKLTKIQSKNSDNTAYYTTVTSNNYYVIKLYTQTSKYPELGVDTRFTDTFLGSLYLN